MAQRIHPAISQKITLLVCEGATNAQEIRQTLREYVQSEFKDYCPSNKQSILPTLDDIRYTTKLGLDFSKFDQDNLNLMIKKWKDQGSTASHFFHPHTKKEGPNDQFTKNLWVHQEQWQKELMCNYRNSITLIDATYKTTRYDLPLCLSATYKCGLLHCR